MFDGSGDGQVGQRIQLNSGTFPFGHTRHIQLIDGHGHMQRRHIGNFKRVRIGGGWQPRRDIHYRYIAGNGREKLNFLEVRFGVQDGGLSAVDGDLCWI